jgi:hypothetical protein
LQALSRAAAAAACFVQSDRTHHRHATCTAAADFPPPLGFFFRVTRARVRARNPRAVCCLIAPVRFRFFTRSPVTGPHESSKSPG